MAYQPKMWEIAGFDLIGYKQPDGTLLLGTPGTNQTKVDSFPPECELNGVVYTLEEVKQNELTPEGNGDPTICWGLYA